jgi:hypothetical protein
MAFKKGESGNSEGRPKGTPNKLTATVKDVFTTVFTELQSDSEVNLKAWGKDNPTEFYKLCSKLIPAAVEMKAEIEGVEQVFKIGNVEIKL